MTYAIVAFYGPGDFDVLKRGILTRDAAHKLAGDIWKNDYNCGRSEHTPTMGHNSGIMSLGVRKERACDACDGASYCINVDTCDACDGKGELQ